jgi:hypothetical protein
MGFRSKKSQSHAKTRGKAWLTLAGGQENLLNRPSWRAWRLGVTTCFQALGMLPVLVSFSRKDAKPRRKAELALAGGRQNLLNRPSWRAWRLGVTIWFQALGILPVLVSFSRKDAKARRKAELAFAGGQENLLNRPSWRAWRLGVTTCF